MVNTQDYAYNLPVGLIAKEPKEPRDESRLFVYDTQTDGIVFDNFYNLDKYLPPLSFLVLNETKVLPSRITMRKKTGGKVKVLFLVNEHTGSINTLRVFVDRKVNPGDELFFSTGESVRIIEQKEHLFKVSHAFTRARLFDLLKEGGTMPIPLYIKNTPLREDQLRVKYQTVFARKDGSSAAPTASLHFTREILTKLNDRDIDTLFLTLHVGMGTFAPVEEAQITQKKLHEEWYEMNPGMLQKINARKRENHALVAVGTTVVRTLESVALSGETSGNTDIFIYPPFEFAMTDHLITNFHLPSSSLMMLVEAFLQHKKAKRNLLQLYKIAIHKKFRFYSFGDAMLIL